MESANNLNRPSRNPPVQNDVTSWNLGVSIHANNQSNAVKYDTPKQCNDSFAQYSTNKYP